VLHVSSIFLIEERIKGRNKHGKE